MLNTQDDSSFSPEWSSVSSRPRRGYSLRAADVKLADPASVVMIVNRDSNDISFMDIKTHKMVGKVFLGNNVNPHMVMMSPDGRYVVTGGTRANKAYIIDAKTLQLVKVINVDIAPEHLSFSPDSRWYYQGNPEGDSISVIDMVSLTKIKTIPGFAEPLNVTFSSDGSKAYVGNYGAHWVGVIDVRRHELLKKIQVAEVPGVAKLDPAKYLGEIKGINIAAPTNDGRFLYAADGDLGVVGVIDPREDKVIKIIRVGKNPVAHLHEPRRQVRRSPPTTATKRSRSSIFRPTRSPPRSKPGPNMTGVNFAAGKAFVISSTSGFVYHVRHEDAAAGGPDQDRHEHPARDGDHRHQGREALSRRVDRRTRSSSSTPRRGSSRR